MSLKDDFETLDPGAEVQAAYDKAPANNWTIARQSAALSMGAKILSGVLGDEIIELQERGTYPNALHDVVIVLWLESLTPAEVIRVNTKQSIEESTGAAYNWAEVNGVKYGSPAYLVGLRKMAEIVGGIFTSFYGVEATSVKREPLRKNGSRRLGKSARPSTQSKPGSTITK